MTSAWLTSSCYSCIAYGICMPQSYSYPGHDDVSMISLVLILLNSLLYMAYATTLPWSWWRLPGWPHLGTPLRTLFLARIGTALKQTQHRWGQLYEYGLYGVPLQSFWIKCLRRVTVQNTHAHDTLIGHVCKITSQKRNYRDINYNIFIIVVDRQNELNLGY